MKKQGKLKHLIHSLQRHADAWWYAPAVGLMAALDAFILVIPTDGLLIGATLLAPRRWVYMAFMVAAGSTLGAGILALILQRHGLPLLLQISPHIEHTEAWQWSVHLINRWGPLALFLMAVGPLAQAPMVALASLSGMAVGKIFLLVFAGRILKYLFFAWLASHAPNLLGKVWGLRRELKSAGVRARPSS